MDYDNYIVYNKLLPIIKTILKHPFPTSLSTHNASQQEPASLA
jgi:hypothetical protein